MLSRLLRWLLEKLEGKKEVGSPAYLMLQEKRARLEAVNAELEAEKKGVEVEKDIDSNIDYFNDND